MVCTYLFKTHTYIHTYKVYEFAEVDERLSIVLNHYQDVFTEASIKSYDFLFRFCDVNGNGSLTLLETIAALKLVYKQICDILLLCTYM
jgi:hypothetical protein